MPKTLLAMGFAVATLITACGAPGASPSPSLPPGPTPTPSPVPSPTFGPDQIEHPTGAKDIVLRIEQGGGFVPFGFMFTQSPTFTLYGDGTVILKPIDTRMNENPFGGQAFLPWVVGHMSEQDMQALLQFALSTGRLANARENYDNPNVADAGSTFFTINAGGVAKKVSIVALGMTEQGPDQADRNGFAQLADLLNDFQAQSGVDLGDLTAYDPSHYKVNVMVGMGEPVQQNVIDWPWSGDASWDNWKPKPDEGSKEGVVAKELIAQLGLDVPNGGHVGVWVKAPDDTFAQVAVRPMLPEEIDEFLNGHGG
jgi:hypothetical protein